VGRGGLVPISRANATTHSIMEQVNKEVKIPERRLDQDCCFLFLHILPALLFFCILFIFKAFPINI
jgi:hypothetical protein